MKRLCKLAALPATLALTLTAGVATHSLLFTPHVWLSTTSPEKTYTVELTGDKGRPGPFFTSTVRFNALAGGRTVVEGARAHSGDWMDISFELAYPEHAWVSENVLRFWRTPHRPEERVESDALLISNNTGRPIKYLKVVMKDMFLVFGVRPHSALRLSTTHQPWSGGVWVEGEFEDGRRINQGAGFPNHHRVKEPLRYCVSVNADEVKIESQQPEGDDPGGGWESLSIRRAPDCNP